MKFLCDNCSRLVELKDFTLSEGALILPCPACQQECRIPPPEVMDRKPAPVLELARPKPPPTGPLCPKCGEPRPDTVESCAKCGVVFALFKPENLALPGPLEELWKAIEAKWDDTARHEVFQAACLTPEVLGEAVRRYRIKSQLMPSDSLASRFRDEAIARLMVHTELPLNARADASEAIQERSRRLALLMLVLSVGLLLGATVWILRLSGQF